MDEIGIVVFLKDERLSWDDTLHMTKKDGWTAQSLRFLRPGTQVDLPSIQGSAKVEEGRLEFVYWSRASKCEKTISVQVAVAVEAISKAIDVAVDKRRSDLASIRIWDWVNERYEGARVLTLAIGDRVTATVVHREDEFLAVTCDDGSAAIVSNLDDGYVPTIGTTVVFVGVVNGSIIIER